MEKKTQNKKAEPDASRGWFATLSIRRKLVLLIMLVSSTAIVLASSGFIVYEWFTFRHRMVHDLSAIVEMIGDNCTGALSFDDPADAAEVLHSLRAKAPIEFASICRPDGTVFASWQRDESVPTNTECHGTGEGFEFADGRLFRMGADHSQ